VGSSGIGKTTVLNLLCRFFDPDSGSITIDNIDIRTVKQESLHRHIGIIFQEPSIFGATIYENIRYGHLQATQTEIVDAAKLVNAHEFIQAMPDQYQTLVGEGGLRLSGGQRQRIALARLVLSRPRIILLDEFTSSLDMETEDIIALALKQIFKGCTTLLVSHRLSTVLRANRIAVLQEGAILELGTPKELVTQQAAFARLFGVEHI
jgi:ABC-type multidrug transport system fused ATPase/permease subunit